MQADFIIVGQGICGSLLSWMLMKEGKKVVVIAEYSPSSSGMVASGLINPVTGMRVVTSWLMDELLPCADEVYREIEQQLGIQCYTLCDSLEFYSTLAGREIYEDKIAKQSRYLREYHDAGLWAQWCNFHYGMCAVTGCRVVDIHSLQAGVRNYLLAGESLRRERFDHGQCTIEAGRVTYKDIEAGKIIFCEGSAGLHNPYFSLLPFALNKGEALIVRIPGLPQTHVLKLGIKMVPWGKDLFWVGSSFEWTYDHLRPTDTFRARMEQQLQQCLKLPWTIVHHWASDRPATVDHKPFAGFHPLHPAVGILNGMGAKGCSQAPYFARVMEQHLVHNAPLHPEADVMRYQRILSRA